jgi:hypothetical protein
METARTIIYQFHDCGVCVSEIFQEGGLKEETIASKGDTASSSPPLYLRDARL